MNVACIIPVGPGRLENVREAVKSIVEATMTPRMIVLVCDGEDAWIQEDDPLFEDFSFRTICKRYGIQPVVVHAEKHIPGREQPRNRGVRAVQEVDHTNATLRQGRPTTHVWFLDSDCIVAPGALAAFERANVAVSKETDKRILVGPYDWLAPGYREEPPVTCDDLELVPKLRRRGYDDVADALGRGGSLSEYTDYLENMGADSAVIQAVRDASDMFDQLEFRSERFRDHDETETFRGDLAAGLACFSGNLIWPLDLFTRVGGFWNEIHHGRCEDGELGLRAVQLGIPIAFVPDGRAYHLWHERNNEWAAAANERDVPMLDERHPWVQGRCTCGHQESGHREGKCGECKCNEFNKALFVVEEDGRRFNAGCPYCSWEGNSLLLWDHLSSHGL